MPPEQRAEREIRPGRPGRAATAVLVLSLLTGAVTHGWNVFRYPLYLTDEGIYMGQAWAVLRDGRLSPYTYFYDHAPMGWLTIAGWVGILPGSFSAFGNAINTGRVLMLLGHEAYDVKGCDGVQRSASRRRPSSGGAAPASPRRPAPVGTEARSAP